MNTKKSKNKLKLFIKFAIICLLLMLIILFVIIGLFILKFQTTNLNTTLLTEISTPAQIFSNNNTLIEDNVQGLPYVKIENLNEYTINAFIAIEDKDYYNHKGYNLKRIVSATAKNIFSGKIKEGASTITQQLIKNTHLTNDKTIDRKINEVILAIKLEQNYTKDEIMEMYLNAIYFGNGCYGIESASQFYFNKTASDLNINESAILAGLIKSPANYSPIKNENNIRLRKNLVLNEMYADNAITLAEYQTNTKKDIELNLNTLDFEKQSAYINSALTEASEILNIAPNQIVSNNYKIYTYFDKDLSVKLTESIKHNTTAMHNAILIDNKTSGISAFSSTYAYGATKIQRSPASTIKPILVYGAGIEYGNIFTCSLLEDKPTTYEDGYSPKNIYNKYYGRISAEDALAKSLNIPAINLLKEIGVEKCKSFAKKCGFVFDPSDNGLSLALGAMKYGITIQQLTNAYLCFNNNGKFTNSTFIRKIEDRNGNLLYTHNALQKKVMSEETAYLVGKMMKKTTTNGTCKALSTLPFEIHAKTGTNGTENEMKNTDAICTAQTTKHTACIWYFSKDQTEDNLLDNPSVSQLSPTLKMKEFFEKIYTCNKPQDYKKPSGIITLNLDGISYENGDIELASYNTPQRYIITCEFNKEFRPCKLSKNFTFITPTNLNMTKKDNSIELSFDTLKHQKYELYKEYTVDNKHEVKTLLVLTNKQENIVFEDYDLTNDIEYTYYLKIINITNEKYEISNIIIDKL